MNWKRHIGAVMVLAAAAGGVSAQTITSLGSGNGSPVNVTDEISGTRYIGGTTGYWTLSGGTLVFVSNGSSGGGGRISEDAAYQSVTQQNNGTSGGGIARIFGNGATAVSPAFRPDPTLTASTTEPGATELVARRYDRVANTWQGLGGLPVTGSLHVFGSSSSGGASSTFLSPNCMSSTGRFIGGQGYACQYTTAAGTTITSNTGQQRPWIWDASANGGLGAQTVLPTPFRTSTNTWRRRFGTVYGISTDGTVIMGATEAGSAVLATSNDPDGGRAVVWRWNSGTSTYDMTYLPNGVFDDPNTGAVEAYPITVSFSIGSLVMNDAGTVIVGRGITNQTGALFVSKWTWNSGTSTWDQTNIGYSLEAPPSWLPAEITGCGAGLQTTFEVTGVSEDGNTIIGYSQWKCGSNFSLRGGWIWESTDPNMKDWYDYLVAAGVPGVGTGLVWGPSGDAGDFSKGQPFVGYPVDISPDGNAFVGFHSAQAMLVGATPWILFPNGGPACVTPSATLNPAATIDFSRCSYGAAPPTIPLAGSTQVILNASGSGTYPVTYQWHKGGSPVSDGTTAGGSVITGANTLQMRITNPVPADAGSYTCVITGCTGATATTAASTVQVSSVVGSTASNDTCTQRALVGEGTFTFNACTAFANNDAGSCTTAEWGDVYYEYTPTFTGEARFQTCASLAADTTLQLYSACGSGELICHDNIGTRALAGPGGCNGNKAVIDRYNVVQNVPIIVRVGLRGNNPFLGTPASQGPVSGTLVISQAPPAPANDSCGTPTDVGLGTHGFDLLNAVFPDDLVFGTDFCSTPVDSQTASNRDVWFRFTSLAGGTYNIETCGLASPNITNPMLHVMTDCQGFNVLACDDNTSGCGTGGTQQAQINNLTIPAGPVLIRVSQSGTGSPGTNILSGTGQITISLTTAACCMPNGTCSVEVLAVCTGNGGTPGAAGSTCSPNPCPPGACCVGPACTVNANPATCALNGGTWNTGNSCSIVAGPPHNFCCPTNYDRIGAKDVGDIFAMLADWFALIPGADWNGVGGHDVGDIFAFLADWFVPC